MPRSKYSTASAPAPHRYAIHDTPDYSSQRQQQVPPPPSERSTTPSSSVRALRRTSRFQPTSSPEPSEAPSKPYEARGRPIHLEAVSIGINPRSVHATAPIGPPQPLQQATKPQEEKAPHAYLSQNLSDELEEPSPRQPSDIPERTSSKEPPHPAVRISRGTHSAILWALEEALRQPNPFSSDLEEETASMADILGGGPITSNGNGASTRRPTAPPAQTGSPSRGGVPGPVDIMRKRQERERQKKEKEELTLAELKRQEQETARLQEEMRPREAGRGAQQHQQQAAGAGMGGSGRTGGGGLMGGLPADPQLDAMTQRRQQRAQQESLAAQQQGRTAAAAGSSKMPSTNLQSQQPLRASRVPTGQTEPMFAGAVPTGINQPAPNVPQPNESTATAASAAVTRTSRNSFPHAFERWEALSAHWEGMTSFWIRKLQENTQELDRNPISAQLSRQVSDLSAAGANLFHAVVELQRLRASSERKFQRWFFETRGELERNQEEKATLQKQLDEERMSRQAAIEEAVRKASENAQASSKTLKQLSEMRKELMISKEEARRAWEELGRREQEERDRAISLQQGLPTIVGGVQVVPMTQGVPSRQTSTRDQQPHQRPQTRSDDPGYGSSQAAGAGGYQGYSQSQAPPQQQHPSSSSGGTSQSQSASSEQRHYQQQPQPSATSVGSRGNYGQTAEDNFSEEGQEYMIDEHGRYVLDEQGKKVLFRSPHSAASTPEPTRASQPPVTSYPPSSSQWAYAGGQGAGSSSSSNQPDYSGRDYVAPSWENVPSHHHPTRLSDVIEEDDERSRGSNSMVSRA